MNQQKFVNGTSGVTLAAALAVGGMSAALAAGKGALFPPLSGGDYYLLTLASANNPESSYEVVQASGATGDVLTLTKRAVEGAEQAWGIGDKCENRLPATLLNSLPKFATNADSTVAGLAGPGGGVVSLTGNYVGLAANVLRNFTLANTVNLRKMRAGDVRGRILGVGDSFMSGHGSGGNGLVGQKRGAFLTKLAKLLTGAGVPAAADYAFGTGTASAGITAAQLATFDPRLSFSGCSTLDGYPTLGGALIALLTAGDKVTFTPGGDFDTVELIFPRNNVGQGDFTVSIDGGTTVLQTIANNVTPDVGIATIAVPPGTRAVTISKGNGGSYITGIGTRKASTPVVEILNAGISAAQVATLAIPAGSGSAFWNTRACLPKVLDANALNLTLINGWYNDRTAGRSAAQVAADLTTVITAAKACGDVIYISYPALATGSIPAVDFATYNDAAIAAAIAAGIPVIDISKLILDQAAGNALGLYFDSLHLNNAGHAYPATTLKTALLGSIPSPA